MPARTGKPKSRADFYKDGDSNAICDRSGFKMKASDCQMEWNNLFVRKESWEQRHPQDFLRGFPDDQTPDISRPGNEDVFVGLTEVSRDDL